MKGAPLTVGSILLIVGLVGIVFSRFSVYWMWALVVAGIIVIIWTGLSPKDKNALKK